MVKKLNKKIMVMVLSGVLSVMSCIPVMAAEDVSVHVHEGQICVEEEISPLANYEGCPACATGELVLTSQAPHMLSTTTMECIHDPDATWDDTLVTWFSEQTYTCNKCGHVEIAKGTIEQITCNAPYLP